MAALALAALVAGCAGPAATSSSTGPADRGAEVRRAEFSIDAPSGGAAGYTVHLEVSAFNADRSESYAWAGAIAIHIDAIRYTSGKGDCVPGQTSFDLQRTVAPSQFVNHVGAGEHWSLPIDLQETGFADGEYQLKVTLQPKSAGALAATGSFQHC